jgi:hypothetical protein
LTKHELVEEDVLKHVLLDMDYSIENFEPTDLIRTIDCIDKVPADVIQTKSASANTVAEWSLKRWEEFTLEEWDDIRRFAPICSEWHRQRLENVRL